MKRNVPRSLPHLVTDMESTRYQRLSAGDKDEQELDNSEQDYIPTARWSDRTKINLLILSNLSLVFTLSALCFLLWRPNWFAPRNAELRAISFYCKRSSFNHFPASNGMVTMFSATI